MSQPSSDSVRVRIAPSPTGDPHVGTAYIALFNYVFAKKSGGKFVLRIEDTDQARARPDSEAEIFSSLRWLGLAWDEGPDIGGDFGPYRQSERTAIYQKHTAALVDSGAAYRCFCTQERIEALRVQQRAAKQNPRYDGHCRALSPEVSKRRLGAGEAYTVRLAVPASGTIRFRDRLRGDVEIAVTQLDDQVLLKSDGFPTYHLANVVDDHTMHISHVIRAEEWISSTPKHVLLYRAFGWREPEWIHMPLLRNRDKSKISKRKNPVSINFYRDLGVLPSALTNFLGNLGWSYGDDREKFTVEEMIEVFSWDKVSVGGPVFDQEKLRWLNELYIHDLSPTQLVDALLAWRFGRETLERVAPLVQKRIKLLSDFAPATDWLFAGDLDYEPVATLLQVSGTEPAVLRKAILELVENFESAPEFSASTLEQVSRDFCERHVWKSKDVFMLLRLGVCGKKASPPLFETMEVIGKEMVRRRLRQLAEFVGRNK